MAGFDERRATSVSKQEYDMAETEVGHLLTQIQFAYRCRLKIDELKEALKWPLSQLEKAETDLEDFKAEMEQLASEIENLRSERELVRRKEPRKFEELTRQIAAKEREQRDRQRRLGLMAENIRAERNKIKDREMEINMLVGHIRPPDPARYPGIISWFQAALNGHE